MPEPIEMVLLGAGNRGTLAYGRWAALNPHQVRFTAVAEPDPARRERFAREHGIPAERQFASWEELLSRPALAPALLNATMDDTHVASTLAAIGAGYHVLLEKPMAVTAEDCVRLVQAAEEAGTVLQICHVMRYALFWRAVRDIVQSGRLGRVITVEHRENVAYWHMAHSFVRGNWGNSGASAPMLLAKCCHDLDALYWILGSPVRALSSFGRLTHFRAENAPEGAPERCTDGCPAEASCAYHAPRLYLTESVGRPAAALSLDLSVEGRLRALREEPYGRCVYRCDNDVVDHQVIAMELEDDTTVSFAMHGHSHDNTRTMRYDGTRATLRATTATHEITIHDHLNDRVETIRPGAVAGGHGGGDAGVMNAFVATLRGDPSGAGAAITSARASLESHLTAFAAERARTSGAIVNMAAYRQEVEAAGRRG